jgi:hypothetical protein
MSIFKETKCFVQYFFISRLNLKNKIWSFIISSEKYFEGNDHLTEIQLIKIVIFQLIEIFNN